jgi:Na+/serine symporter
VTEISSGGMRVTPGISLLVHVHSVAHVMVKSASLKHICVLWLCGAISAGRYDVVDGGHFPVLSLVSSRMVASARHAIDRDKQIRCLDIQSSPRYVSYVTVDTCIVL